MEARVRHSLAAMRYGSRSASDSFPGLLDTISEHPELQALFISEVSTLGLAGSHAYLWSRSGRFRAGCSSAGYHRCSLC